MEGATTRDILERALLVGALPEHLRDVGGKIVDQLQRQVRVTLLGLPGSGKSAVLNLLAGAEVIPDGTRLPTTQLIKGANTRATITLPNGESEVLEDTNAAQIAERRPVFVELEMDLPALGKISILEVVTGVNRSQQSRAALWAAKRTDLAIWCTRSFTPAEQATWSGLPDALKDHGILLRTAADEFGDPYIWPEHMARLQELGQDEFRAIIPIATLEALAARQTGGAVDKARFRASGAPALISTILKVVDLGRQALIDQADVILHKYGIDESVFDEPIPEPAPEDDAVEEAVEADEEEQDVADDLDDVVEEDEDDLDDEEEISDDEDDDEEDVAAAAPEPEPEPEAEPKWSETAIASIMARLSGDPIEPDPQPEPEDSAVASAAQPVAEVPEPAPTAANVIDDIWGTPDGVSASRTTSDEGQTIAVATADALRSAVDRLSRVGEELLDDGDLTPMAVMRRSVDEMQWLSDHLEATEADDDAIEAARMAAMDATDLVQLMQIEKRDSAAMEAISLMIQMRRGFRQTLAAA
ncbi:MAG: hypothetical protein AAF919_15265 [Pseudomonadota bacterium]